MEMNRPFWN